MEEKEAIERIKARFDKWALDDEDMKAIQTLIPELTESEDEKIRKWLIAELKDDYFTDYTPDETKAKAEKVIAWLEKQKEASKAIEAVERIDKYIDLNLANAHDMKDSNPDKKYYRGWDDALAEMARILQDVYSEKKQKESLRDFIDDFPYSDEQKDNKFAPRVLPCSAAWFEDGEEKQKEHKPAEWSENYRKENIQTRFAFYTYKDDPSTLYLSNVFVEEASRNHGFGTRILRAAEKVAETIGATTIRLKVKQDSPANAWYRKNGYGYVTFEDGYDWLEKNLEYMKPKHSTLPIEQQMEVAMIAIRGEMPSNSQEWSEEDEAFLKVAIAICNRYSHKDIADWLKSLRPSWKPSEEQMKALEECGECKRCIKELYEDIKKRYGTC